jgi:hypothetical protein
VSEVLFDYSKLEPEVGAFGKERETLIREAAKRTAQGIVLIGQWLTEVKDRLPHGQSAGTPRPIRNTVPAGPFSTIRARQGSTMQ